MACGSGQGRGCSRGRQSHLHAGTHDASRGASHLARNKPAHALQFAFARRIVAEKFISEPHCAQRQADSVADMPAPGNGKFTTATAEINHQNRGVAEAKVGDQAEVDQSALFQAGDNLDRPSRGRTHPFQKSLRVSGIAQGAGGDDANRIRSQSLGRAMEAAQHLDRFRHRRGRQEIGAKNAFPQTSDLAVFVNCVEAAAAQTGNLEADRVRTDINRGEDGHGEDAFPILTDRWFRITSSQR